MGENVIYATLVRYDKYGVETQSQKLELPQRKFITVGEVLLRFNVIYLPSSDHIWIKREGFDFRTSPYAVNIQLPTDTFLKFTLVLAGSLEEARKLLVPKQLKPEEKPKRRGPSRYALLREKAIRGIIKKKRLARITKAKENDDKETPD